MTVYQLPGPPLFPAPEDAEPDGLIAIGGDLSVERLLAAYSAGIFPWYGPEDPILWWSPDPRLVLELSDLKVSKSLRRVIKKKAFTVSVDRDFDRVVRQCAQAVRTRGEGTWIVQEMIAAYAALHQAGFAHSLEIWIEGQLAGGLYGVSLGRAFFGESMFSRVRDASKIALVCLVGLLRGWDFDFIDCQVSSDHLLRLGAREIPRSDFLQRLSRARAGPTRCGRWALPENFDLPF